MTAQGKYACDMQDQKGFDITLAQLKNFFSSDKTNSIKSIDVHTQKTSEVCKIQKTQERLKSVIIDKSKREKVHTRKTKRVRYHTRQRKDEIYIFFLNF